MLDEADTRAKLIDPNLHKCGWTEEMIRRERYVTKGRVLNKSGDRLPRKRVDYLLYYPEKNGTPIAIVEAKSEVKSHLAGMQQAKKYRRMMGVFFAYSTNGHKIEEYDHFLKKQVTLERFPSPKELWRRYVENEELKAVIQEGGENPLAYPYYPFPDKPIRYYQEVAVKNAIEAILRGRKKVLLTMGTGSGKTYVAFQIAWKLYKTRKIRRTLYLVDRIFLRRQSYEAFWPFGNAREILTADKITKVKDIYFVTYQTLYSEKNGKKLYELFDPEFFDMVIIDECHRSGWKRWYSILEHFSGAIHLGLTATPKRTDNIDTYDYFGTPVYDYSLRQGIEDGFLAPCEIIRAFTNIDKTGGLSISEVTSQGAKIEVPKDVELKEYYSKEAFEREITLPDRTERICEHLANILESTGPKGKTAIFCVSQSHAADVTKELNNRFGAKFEVDNYAVRVVADEPYAHETLKDFRNSEKDFPVVTTTVDLLSTGVDIPPVRNLVFLKPVNSKVQFHQIIGRGSRIDDVSEKFMFRIIDYTNATRLFDSWDLPRPIAPSKPEGPFDWYLPCKIVDGEIGYGISDASVVVIRRPNEPVEVNTDERGFFLLKDMPRSAVKIDISASGYKKKEATVPTFPEPDQAVAIALEREVKKRKELIRAKNVEVYIAEEGTLRINTLGNELRKAEYIEYCKKDMIKRIVTLNELKKIWKDKERRMKFKKELEEKGIDLNILSKLLEKPDVDEFDLIANILFKAPIVNRDERARAVLDAQKEFVERFGPKAREVMLELVDRYRMGGIDEITNVKVFETPPFDKMGYLRGMIKVFGGIKKLKKAIKMIENSIYPEFKM